MENNNALFGNKTMNQYYSENLQRYFIIQGRLLKTISICKGGEITLSVAFWQKTNFPSK